MKKNILYIGSVLLILVYNALCLYSQSQQEINNFEQWDKKTIQEAEIWQNLLVNYYFTDRSYQWNTRRQKIQKVIEQYPKSLWTDDAALMLACDEAVIHYDLDGGISSMRQIIADYPNASTIISGWDSEIGCKINNTWLLWAHRLVSSKRDSATTLAFPFDKDRDIGILENEALVSCQDDIVG